MHEELESEGVPEPLTSAAALVGKGANALITPKIRDQLFGPVAKAYGEHWGEEVREKLAAKRIEKRARNAESHIGSLNQLNFKRSYEDLFIDPQFQEWAAGASEIDPDLDPDLSNFWRAALIALAEGNPVRLRLLRMVKALGTDDAVYLASGRVNGMKFRGARDLIGGHLNRLEKADVLESFWRTVWRRPISFLPISLPSIIYLIGLIITGYIAIVTIQPPFFFQHKITSDNGIQVEYRGSQALVITDCSIAMVAFATVSITYGIIARYGEPERTLTPDGLQLMKLLAVVRRKSMKSDDKPDADPVIEILKEPQPRKQHKSSRNRGGGAPSAN